MSKRTFIFCDICNPNAIRVVEARRNGERGDRYGRRTTDGRAWFDGNIEDAYLAGWIVKGDGRHVCPECNRLRRYERRSDGSATGRKPRPRGSRSRSRTEEAALS